MSLDFPASPSNGQTFTSPGPPPLSWTFDGTKWLASSAGAAAYVAKTGDTMSGALTLPGAPTVPLHAATKAYVDAGNPVPLPIASGGTNATTAPAALTSLGAVPAAGGTMTGTLSLASPGTSNLVLVKNSAGDNADINSSFGGNTRWSLRLGDAVAEAGSNTGTDFVLHRFADGGGYLAQALTISRATGDVFIASNLGVGASPPLAKLHVFGAGQTPGTAVVTTDGNLNNAVFLSDSTGSAGSGGMIVFGAASNAWRFAAIKGWATDGASNSRGDIVFSTRRAATDTALTEQMRVNDVGVRVGAATGSPAAVGYLNAVGVYANGVALTSDASLKADIEPLPAACLPLVAAVEPKSFRWQEPDDGESSGRPDDFSTRRHSGFLAPDLADAAGALPGIVEGEPGKGMALDVGAMLATLWQAVRELAAEVAALKAAR